MRVLYLSDNPSGHNRRFLQKLAASEHEIWFCNIASTDTPHGWLPAGVRQFLLTAPIARRGELAASAQQIRQLHAVLDDVRPDIVHAGPIQTCGYPVALCGFHPLLLASWGFDMLVDPGRNEAWREATHAALRGADALFVDSTAVLRTAQRFLRRDIPVVQFPWGVELDRFKAPRLRPSHSRSGAFTFLCTRSWETEYGIETLLDAFASAHRFDEALRLVLVGSGSQSAYVSEFISTHRLTDRIRTPGNAEAGDMPAWFQSSDGYVSCAVSDGSSVSLLEAMASELPVVVTDNPSNREWVTPGTNGWVANTADEFAAAMLDAARSPQPVRDRMGALNREIVVERADWDRNFPQLLAMYDRLAQPSHANGRAHPGRSS